MKVSAAPPVSLVPELDVGQRLTAGEAARDQPSGVVKLGMRKWRYSTTGAPFP